MPPSQKPTTEVYHFSHIKKLTCNQCYTFVMEFYNLKTKQKVEVPDEKVELVTTENGRKAAKAEVDGMKLFKFLSKEDAARLEALGK